MRCEPFGLGLQQREEPLTVLIAKALGFAQRFQLLFSVSGVLPLSLQLNNQTLQPCQASLPFDYVAFDVPQLIMDWIFVHRSARSEAIAFSLSINHSDLAAFLSMSW
jgi:hypothetical protein